VRTDRVSSADRHAAERLTADPRVRSLSRHFPTFYFLWKCLLFCRNGLRRRRRAIGSTLAVAAFGLVVLYGCRETVNGRQRNAVAAIQKARGSVAYDWEWINGRPAPPGAEPPWPSWLVKTLGRDAFGHVVAVDLVGGHADDALMTHIGRLHHLERLNLNTTTLWGTGLARLENLTAPQLPALPTPRISDDDLAHLAGMTKLEQLDLVGPLITNKGLTNLAGMRQMESLRLIDTKITTLEPIRGLAQLKVLSLSGSPIGDEGLSTLKGFTSLQWLELGGTRLTDAGIAHLSTLSNLAMLDLNRTRVGDAGVWLVLDLPRIMSLNLYDTRVTDAGLADLADKLNGGPCRHLVVAGPGVTSGGVAELRKKLTRASVMGPDRVVYTPLGRAPDPAAIEDEEMPMW
jgi:hypothetical protein